MLRKLFIFGILMSGFFAQSQDIHYSQFYMNPVYLNPALTGNFDGNYRFSAQQRSQWRSVSRPYNTFGFSVESKEGWILPNLYHGLSFFHDVAGDGNFRTTEISLSTAYHLDLGKDSVHSITPAFRASFNHRTIDFTQFTFGSQYNGYYYDATLPTNESFAISSRPGFNFSAGAIYRWNPELRKDFVFGVGWFNIPQIKQSFMNDDNIKRDRRVLLHLRGTFKLNDKWDIQPAVMTQFQGTFIELVAGTNLRYIMEDKRKETGEFLAPYGGVFYRGVDAVNFVGGFYYNNWIAGVSYDLNLSELTAASKARGGLEFQIQYILKLFKPKVVQFRVCPDYM